MAIASNMVKPPMWAPGVNWSHPLAKGLVFIAPMWFDTAAQIRDLSGHGRHLTPTNTPTYEDSTKGKAWLFDNGASEYAYNNNSAPVTDYPFSMACWFKTDDITAQQVLMNITDRSQNDTYASLVARLDEPGDTLRAISRSAAAGAKQAIGATGVTVNKWHLATGVWASAAERHIFIDGGGKGTDTNSVATSGYDSVAIGRLHRLTPAAYMSGHIMLPMIWNRALSDAEVLQLYTDPWAIITPGR